MLSGLTGRSVTGFTIPHYAMIPQALQERFSDPVFVIKSGFFY